MKVMGIVDFSTADWPGKAATVIFFEGCPLACPRCHNRKFNGDGKEMSIKQLITHLKESSKVMDAVVFSGGEAVAHAMELSILGREAKEMGLLVGIETSGVFSEKLKYMLQEGIIDRVFLDIKGPWNDSELLQERTGGTVSDLSYQVARSLTYIMRYNVPLELRMTVFPDYPSLQEITSNFLEIGRIFKGLNREVNYRLLRGYPVDGVDDFEPLSIAEITALAQRVEDRIWELQATVTVGAK